MNDILQVNNPAFTFHKVKQVTPIDDFGKSR
jgi:hypothetical protein